VHALNTSAFGRSGEAQLVDALRAQAQPFVSLVAEEDGAVVGRIMFTPVSLPGYSGLIMASRPCPLSRPVSASASAPPWSAVASNDVNNSGLPPPLSLCTRSSIQASGFLPVQVSAYGVNTTCRGKR